MTNQNSKNSWTFLTNHGHVLLALYRNADLRQRDIAHMVGITEGAVHRILTELEQCGYIDIQRIGRRNHYQVDPTLGLRHPVEAGHSVGEVLEQLGPETTQRPRSPRVTGEPRSDQPPHRHTAA